MNLKKGQFVEITPTSDAPSWIKDNAGEVFVVEIPDKDGALLDNGLYCPTEWLMVRDIAITLIEEEECQ